MVQQWGPVEVFLVDGDLRGWLGQEFDFFGGGDLGLWSIFVYGVDDRRWWWRGVFFGWCCLLRCPFEGDQDGLVRFVDFGYELFVTEIVGCLGDGYDPVPIGYGYDGLGAFV